MGRRSTARTQRRGAGIDPLAVNSIRVAAGAAAGAGVAVLACLPLLLERGFPQLEGGLALAAGVTTVAALIVAPLLLPAAVALLAAELVVSVHRGGLALWGVPLVAVGLVLVYETAELRHRLPQDFVIERAPLRALARRLALTVALAFFASATVLAASGVSSRGGAAAAVVGALAAAAVVVLIEMLAATEEDAADAMSG